MPETPSSCSACTAPLPPGARFCASCGTRVAGTRGPISWDVADRRYFGVLPGRRFFRRARARLARIWGLAVARLRLVRGRLSAGSRERVETLMLRREAGAVLRGREQALRDLGDAVYRNEPGETEGARQRVVEADGRLADLEEKLRQLHEETRNRIDQAWREEGPTVIEPVPPAEPPVPPLIPEPAPLPSDPPGPVIVPEPGPVPHEPPGPVIVPEPGPVPHEPPGPVIVPEPTPPS